VKDKRQLKHIFSGSIFFATAAYAFMGIVLASAFGTGNIQQSANLNWKNCYSNDDDYYTKLISLYIILFPAIDVVSAFPLNAITLGNNIMGTYFGSRIQEYENDNKMKRRFRLLAACPPILMGLWVRELGKITDYAGTTGFIIGFSIPALLYLCSKSKASSTKSFVTTTFYNSYASSNVMAYTLFLFGLGVMIYVSITLTMDMYFK